MIEEVTRTVVLDTEGPYRGPIIGRAFPCGCDTRQEPGPWSRCRDGWALWQQKAAAKTDVERHAVLVKIAAHQSSEGQKAALR